MLAGIVIPPPPVLHSSLRADAIPGLSCDGGSLLYGPHLGLSVLSGTRNPTEKGQKLCFSHTSFRPAFASCLWSSLAILVKLSSQRLLLKFFFRQQPWQKERRGGDVIQMPPGVTGMPARHGPRDPDRLGSAPSAGGGQGCHAYTQPKKAGRPR